MVKSLLVMFLSLGMLIGLAGCNTMAGAGQDVQRGGEAVEDSARDTQQRMR